MHLLIYLQEQTERPVMSYRKPVDWEKVALDLWRLLDDIDTLDDACKDNDASFRKHVYAVQQKRHYLIEGSEWEARIAQYEPHSDQT